jgi:nucleoid DNA-binding protein
MNRSQLVDRSAHRAADEPADDSSERVTLPDFGSLTRTARKAGTEGTRQGAAIEIAATKGEKFTAGAGFKSAVN